MQDDVSRLTGIDGLVVTDVADHGWWVELEVELVGRASCCLRCGRGSLTVKDRDVVRARDLPIAGRITYLLGRKLVPTAILASGGSPRPIRTAEFRARPFEDYAAQRTLRSRATATRYQLDPRR